MRQSMCVTNPKMGPMFHKITDEVVLERRWDTARYKVPQSGLESEAQTHGEKGRTEGQ